MIPFLPNEILQNILEYVREERYWHARGLARCCRSSKTFLAIARPLLYRQIEISVGVVQRWDLGGYTQFQFGWRGCHLVRILKLHPHLRQLVQQISLHFSEGAKWDEDAEEEPEDIFDPLVELLDSGTVVVFHNVTRYHEIDEAVCSAQFKNKSVGKTAPLFRRVSNPCPSEWGEEELKTAFEGYKSNRYSSDPEELLLRSFDTLVRLDIPFASATPLQQFHRLERLKLRLSDDLHLNNEDIDVDRDLVTLLPILTSLRFLVLTSDSDKSFDPTDLLESGILAESLPPKLTQLSLELVLESSEVLSFLEDLPQATTLQRLNYRWRNDQNQEVVGECRTRQIELRLNQKWEIW